ncbi:MAG: DUF4198 domain-containing protein [Bacteroidota bacterium]|nr:DUF4198 domain-containing protein [Bacteroidota bacterium]
MKAILQAGDEQFGAFGYRLNHPLEIIPANHPYSLTAGDTLYVQVLLHEASLGDHFVYASYDTHPGFNNDGKPAEAVQSRTDSTGIAAILISSTGRWYVRVINIEELQGSDITHDSNRSAIAFEVD